MSNRYVHGYASEEQERLVEQAEHWREELILSGTKLAPGTRLLEVGCGVGAVLGILGDAFPGVVLSGVDIEDRQLGAARAHLADLGLQADLRRADAAALTYEDASFDHVWMMWFLEHVPDPVAALKEARRGARIHGLQDDRRGLIGTWRGFGSEGRCAPGLGPGLLRLQVGGSVGAFPRERFVGRRLTRHWDLRRVSPHGQRGETQRAEA